MNTLSPQSRSVFAAIGTGAVLLLIITMSGESGADLGKRSLAAACSTGSFWFTETCKESQKKLVGVGQEKVHLGNHLRRSGRALRKRIDSGFGECRRAHVSGEFSDTLRRNILCAFRHRLLRVRRFPRPLLRERQFLHHQRSVRINDGRYKLSAGIQ